ncbi:MAG TPA: FAD-dependent oxidoreductase [Polyangia bacterium]|nr:FAD-dependent oxidoreductase [Polyangia bacterium]
MATAKTARIIEARALGPETRLLDLEPAEPLGFVGGQYVIVDSGVVLDGGKKAKRAYSILSSDARQDRVQIAVRRIAAGPGSSYMHALAVGDTVTFSGPWGQYLPDDARPRATWVIATDTGVTAALGLTRGLKFAPQRERARRVWLVESANYFLPREFLDEGWIVLPLPPPGHPERVDAALDALRAMLEREGAPESAFLSGDGAVLWPLRDALAQAGLAPERVRLEAFFNNPAKKST